MKTKGRLTGTTSPSRKGWYAYAKLCRMTESYRGQKLEELEAGGVVTLVSHPVTRAVV